MRPTWASVSLRPPLAVRSTILALPGLGGAADGKCDGLRLDVGQVRLHEPGTELIPVLRVAVDRALAVRCRKNELAFPTPRDGAQDLGHGRHQRHDVPGILFHAACRNDQRRLDRPIIAPCCRLYFRPRGSTPFQLALCGQDPQLHQRAERLALVVRRLPGRAQFIVGEDALADDLGADQFLRACIAAKGFVLEPWVVAGADRPVEKCRTGAARVAGLGRRPASRRSLRIRCAQSRRVMSKIGRGSPGGALALQDTPSLP